MDVMTQSRPSLPRAPQEPNAGAQARRRSRRQSDALAASACERGLRSPVRDGPGLFLPRGQGNITGHGQHERRFCCLACGHAFAATKGTPFYRLRTPPEKVALVLALLGYG